VDGLTAHDRAALDAACEQAVKSRDEGGIPIGSALVDARGAIVAAGHNERIQTGDPTAHAEMVCVRRAGRRRDWRRLTMATTLSPCAMCAGTCVLYRIPRVVIGERDSFKGREDWLEQSGAAVVHAHDERCVELMRAFIRDHADVWGEDIGDCVSSEGE